jgi:RNA polymerase sigma-70 factor (ECF subfamily)
MKALEAGFAQIVKENRSTIYTVCYMFSKDPDEVGDLFQETLINLWRGFASFKGKSEVSTWIWRVSLNTCISSERKKKLRRTEPLSMELNVFDSRDEDNRQIQMLQSRIHRLQPFDRAIVLLWLENLSYEEIASIVGISVKNVSVRLFRIKEELKKMSND